MATDTTVADTAIGAFFVLFAILGTIFNCGVIAVVLFSRNLRSKGMYITIVGISFAGLLQSIFVNSVFAHVYLSALEWCPEFFGALVTTDVCLAVTMYCLFLLFMNHLIHQFSPNESRERNAGIVGTILISVLFVIILVPIIKTQSWSWSKCIALESIYFGNYNLRVGLIVVEFLLPTFLLCVGRIIIIFIFEQRVVVPGGLIYQRSSGVPTHLIVAALTIVATNMPGRIFELARVSCSYPNSCEWIIWLRSVLQMIYLGNVVVIPLSWLLDIEFRQSFRTMLGRNQH